MRLVGDDTHDAIVVAVDAVGVVQQIQDLVCLLLRHRVDVDLVGVAGRLAVCRRFHHADTAAGVADHAAVVNIVGDLRDADGVAVFILHDVAVFVLLVLLGHHFGELGVKRVLVDRERPDVAAGLVFFIQELEGMVRRAAFRRIADEPDLAAVAGQLVQNAFKV